MAFHFLLVFALLNIVFLSSQGIVLEEAYWKSVFPNNPMPKALRDILPPSDSINGSIKDSNASYHAGSYRNEQSIQEASIDSNLNNNFKVDDNIVSVDETTFFFQRDLRTGKLVNLPNLIATGDKTPFLPDRVAKSIPFSSAKLPEILNHFSGCERAAINGEQKFCATSLESFIDLSISKLGKQIQLLSIEFSKETKNPLFTISRGMQNMGEHELVCHKMEYPGAVFLCHALNKTGVYKVGGQRWDKSQCFGGLS
ncbi:hypothetical protein ES332_A08G015400v1 [Gossypium tomentosum]|uniref:BURP domain-containing protein n=1 Tax=Gossypium tomentosum TaxID=34277 RepID=A0A5D2PAF9_GOSTO|nr:hypothetical protein ES332_A08G015400v1 [Gossypium tomentosum]